MKISKILAGMSAAAIVASMAMIPASAAGTAPQDSASQARSSFRFFHGFVLSLFRFPVGYAIMRKTAAGGLVMERLDKIIAGTGKYSRREVKELVRQGRVIVDGRLASSPEEKVDADAACLLIPAAL